MNRIDRLYALVEELRAAGTRGVRQGGWPSTPRSVSVRSSATGAHWGRPASRSRRSRRTGGYTLDRSMSLPPLNITPREAAAAAMALSRSEHVLFTRDARSAASRSWLSVRTTGEQVPVVETHTRGRITNPTAPYGEGHPILTGVPVR